MAQARMIDDLVGEQISMGLQLSVSCAEDAPLLDARADDADTCSAGVRRDDQGRMRGLAARAHA